MSVTWTWERCVRDISLCADPAKVGRLSSQWRALADDLLEMTQDLRGRPVGTVSNASGVSYQHEGGLAGKMAAWRGAGGRAYVDHVTALGDEVAALELEALKVSSALDRIAQDLQKAVNQIPVPIRTATSWTGEGNYSLPNKTALGNAWDSKSPDAIRRVLCRDYLHDPGGYADGAFRKIADDLESTVKMGPKSWGYDNRGGMWDTKSFLDDWYRDCTNTARSAASPVPPAVADERPNLTIGAIAPGQGGIVNDLRDGTNPGTSYGSDTAHGIPQAPASNVGGGASIGAAISGSGTSPLADANWFSEGDDPGSGLAGVAGSGLVGADALGVSGGIGTARGVGAPGGLGMPGTTGGSVPGLVASGGRGVSPLTSPWAALQSAGARRVPGAPGSTGMMGGAGVGGGAGSGSEHSGRERRTLLIEDESPWKLDAEHPPGVLGSAFGMTGPSAGSVE